MYMQMYDSLQRMLVSLVPFTTKELDDASPFFDHRSLEKNEFFNKAGRISDTLGFVSRGLLRSFYTLKGKDTTTFFQLPGAIAVDLKSFVKKTPSIENIQAVADSELLVIKRGDLYALYNESWKWQQVGRMLVEQAYFEMEERSISLQIQSAQDRYDQFLSEFPEVIQQVPLHQIASFLGISPETLSRIRKHK
jgi:CRP-like cAMP-binding protein